MTIAEAERFYKQDEHLYELAKNKEFLGWLKDKIANGYHCFIEVDELQELINNITTWYEMKYPERELEYYEGVRYLNFEDIKRISNVMDMRQLLYRLPHKQLSLIECGFRACGWGQYPIYENGKEVGWKTEIFMRITRKDIDEDDICNNKLPYFLIHADPKTGIVDVNSDLEEYTDKKDISLDELLELFRENNEALDCSELEECLYDRECDLTLRYRILQLIALSLLYSKNTIPERGYERAQRFINEFNKKMNLELSTEEIDEIMSRDYKTEVKEENNKGKARGLVKSLLAKRKAQQ